MLLLIAPCAAAAAEKQPLYIQTPYDRITLDETNENAVIEILPTTFPNRRVPKDPRGSDKIVIRRLDDPEKQYEIPWHSIAKVELFEDMVLKEANKLVAAGKLDEAFDYFVYLEDRDPTYPGLAESIQAYLYEDARRLAVAGQFDASLAVLRELYRRNSAYRGLDKAAGAMTDKRIQHYVEKDQYRDARTLAAELAEMYPDSPVVAKWQTQWKEQATEHLREAAKLGNAGQWARAHAACREILRVWPALEDARPYVESIYKRHPRVVVGVMQPAAVREPGRFQDWASRRSGRLVYRTLMEFVGPGTDGGKYVSPLGELQVRELGRRLTFELRPDLHWATGDDVLTAYDLARQLLAMAAPGDPAFRPQWAELLDSVSVTGVYAVEADLTRPHVRPEALLQTVVAPSAGDPGPTGAWLNGPYTIASQADGEVSYLANDRYFDTGPAQPKEIVERPFQKGAEAIRALREGRLHVVDRVNPWALERLKSAEGVKVEPYAAPLLHCLVPNVRHELTARRKFRRALVYGINREAILHHLLRSEREPGCEVPSGPFLPGFGHDDPLNYAYDDTIEPRGYDPHLALALVQVVLEEITQAKKKQGETFEGIGQLVLAHPPQEIARLACESIRQQLELVGVPVALREVPAELPSQIPDDVDLLYAELAMWEPVVDARRLLGAEGMSRGASPYMGLALKQLEVSNDWAQVGRKLREIHQLAHHDVAVIPLWQLTDHFAYRTELAGVGSQPVTLYQNVEQWRLNFQYPVEEK